LRALAGLAERMAFTAAREGHRVVGVGLGFPEYVRDGVVTSSEVFAWDRQPAEVLAQVVPGVPVRVDGDVRCAALAEARARPADRESVLFYVSWGTGLSSSLVLDGVPLPGHRGEALALGEWPVPAVVDPAWSGNLEQYAAGLALGRRYRERTGEDVDGRGVIGRDVDGDPVAAEVVESAARALAHTLAQVVHVVDPGLIVLGGGLGTSGTRPPLLVAELLPGLLHRPEPPAVVPAVAGSRAGLVGAGLLVGAAG
jgi:glucokinase